MLGMEVNVCGCTPVEIRKQLGRVNFFLSTMFIQGIGFRPSISAAGTITLRAISPDRMVCVHSYSYSLVKIGEDRSKR